jgi:hypothetical protein
MKRDYYAHTKAKNEILEMLGSRGDMLIEKRDVGFDAEKKIHYGQKGEADIRITWNRKYRVVHRNDINPFHTFQKEEVKVVGQALAIEVKTGKAKQTADQKRWQKAFEAAGGIYLIANGGEDAEQQLNTVATKERFILA